MITEKAKTIYQSYAWFYLWIADKWEFILLVIVFYCRIYQVFSCLSLVFHQYAVYSHHISYGFAICYQCR